MTASELAFLALGVLFGAAAGAAFLGVLGDRMGRSEIRVTVTRDAVPRRSGTLSQDAFLASAAGPAWGGPGDRRIAERSEDARRLVSTPWSPDPRPATALERAPMVARDRTIVPSVTGAVAVAIRPEDGELDDLGKRPSLGAPLERMLRGEHRAMVEAVDAVAGADSRQRRRWEILLGGLVESMADIAVRESVIDFPMGTAFWDSFTVEQCRRIVLALASMGYHYDGVSGWVGSRVPAYRDLTVALADIGVEPRRVRSWPNHAEIASLFVGARPAPEELLAAAGPDYTAVDMQALLGEHAAGLADLWLAWDSVRPVLLDETDPSVAATFATDTATRA